jgi:hypothetical protein
MIVANDDRGGQDSAIARDSQDNGRVPSRGGNARDERTIIRDEAMPPIW